MKRKKGTWALETQSVLWLTPAEYRFTKMSQEEWFGGGTYKASEPQKSRVRRAKQIAGSKGPLKPYWFLTRWGLGHISVCLSHLAWQPLRQPKARRAASDQELSWEAGAGRDWELNLETRKGYTSLDCKFGCFSFSLQDIFGHSKGNELLMW